MSDSPQKQPYPYNWEVTNDLTVGNNLTVKGQTTEVDEQITDRIQIEDDSSVVQFDLHGDATTPYIRLNDNNEMRFGTDADGSIKFDPAHGVNGAVTLRDDINNSDMISSHIGGEFHIHNRDAEIDNTKFFRSKTSGGGEVQMLGVTGSDIILMGDVSGNGVSTDIQSGGTTGISIQTNGNINFDNGDVRVNADGNQVCFGAGQDASIQYDGTDMIVNPQEVGSGNVNISAGALDMTGNNILEVGGTTDADAGALRLANTSSINWRDSGNSANYGISLNSNDRLEVDTSLKVSSNSTFVHDRQDVSSNISTDGSGYYSVDSSGGTRTITLATADAVDGKEINVKRNGANSVTVDTEGSQTVDGSTSGVTLSADDESVTLVYNSSNTDWEVY